MRVLIVDDYDATARTLQKLFLRSGHEASVANSGNQAIESARRLCPDVVITDILMPGMDGYELAKAIKVDCGLPARIVGLSAYASSSNDPRWEYIDVFLQKPVAFRELLQAAVGS
jgi:CheY-like chemotaxis protein